MSAPLFLLRSDNVAARRIGDELMIMFARDSSLFSLNETAALLWPDAPGAQADLTVAAAVDTLSTATRATARTR